MYHRVNTVSKGAMQHTDELTSILVFTQQFIIKAMCGLLIQLWKYRYSLLCMYSTGRKCILAKVLVMVMDHQALPLTSHGDSDFDIRQNQDGRAVSSTHWLHLTPKEIPWYSFYLRLRRPQGY
jgi:hypothetical protein